MSDNAGSGSNLACGRRAQNDITGTNADLAGALWSSPAAAWRGAEGAGLDRNAPGRGILNEAVGASSDTVRQVEYRLLQMISAGMATVDQSWQVITSTSASRATYLARSSAVWSLFLKHCFRASASDQPPLSGPGWISVDNLDAGLRWASLA